MGTTIKSICEFGKEYTDSVTGLIGKCTGIAKHQFGCVRICLQPPIDKDGKVPDNYWVDEGQIESEKEPDKTPGGPQNDPSRSGALGFSTAKGSSFNRP